MEDFLEPFRINIENAETEFEKHVFFWCMQYYVPLRQFKHKEVHLCFYENFCENPHDEVERLFGFLGKKAYEDVFSDLSVPSSVSRKDSAIVKGTNLIDSWRKQVTAQDLEKALDILKLFDLDIIYSGDSMPNISAAYEFLGYN